VEKVDFGEEIAWGEKKTFKKKGNGTKERNEGKRK
jgi:hypothetical protein